MPFYRSSDTLYACLQTLFDRIQRESPTALNGLKTSQLMLRLKCTAPSAEVTLNGRQRKLQPSYGPSAVQPDLDVELAADTLHQILTDSLSMKQAMGSGMIKVRGPVWKAAALVDLFDTGRGYYPDVLRQHDLI